MQAFRTTGPALHAFSGLDDRLPFGYGRAVPPLTPQRSQPAFVVN